MRAFAGVAAAVLAAGLAGGSVQAAPGKEPAELPPASFSGNQYVDSQGCVFLRAGLGAQTVWVPRVGRDRKPVCGYAPTLAGSTGQTAETAPAAAAPEPVATEAPASQPQAKKPQPVTPAAARKKAPKPAAPATIALVKTKRVERGATYCAGRTDAAQRYLLSDGRRVTQCAEPAAEPVPYLNGLGVPGLVVSDRAATAGEARRAEAAEEGAYRVTWAKGNLTAAGKAAMATPAGAPAASGGAAAGPYVQIGAFAEPANAERAMQTLGRLGLPVSVGVGGRLRVILAGPFASRAELSDALALVRQNGYRDAFPTRG